MNTQSLALPLWEHAQAQGWEKALETDMGQEPAPMWIRVTRCCS